ncbi:hypothetical protein TNCV_290861 [Trichonephila clavipes]|nr:hypothetical protein TNCV_290861 [Trichonephila clavipes]
MLSNNDNISIQIDRQISIQYLKNSPNIMYSTGLDIFPNWLGVSMTWMTSELTFQSPNYLTNGWKFELSKDLLSIAAPTRRVFSGTGLELMTRSATIRFLDHLATSATVRSLDLSYGSGFFRGTW